jgi:hypothetical protein
MSTTRMMFSSQTTQKRKKLTIARARKEFTHPSRSRVVIVLQIKARRHAPIGGRDGVNMCVSRVHRVQVMEHVTCQAPGVVVSGRRQPRGHLLLCLLPDRPSLRNNYVMLTLVSLLSKRQTPGHQAPMLRSFTSYQLICYCHKIDERKIPKK